MDAALCGSFQCLRRPVQKNLAVLTVTFLRLLGAARGGNGRLSLGMLFRVLPTAGTAHAREKRLRRFLENRRLDPRGVTDGLARLIFGRRGTGLWPILFDQTKSGATQALMAGVPFEGRALPLAVYTFDYPWQETGARSQNRLEEVFLLDVESALPAGARGVFIGDPGDARAAPFRHCGQRGPPAHRHGGGPVPGADADRAQLPGLQDALGAARPAIAGASCPTDGAPAAGLLYRLLSGSGSGRGPRSATGAPGPGNPPSPAASRHLPNSQRALPGDADAGAPSLETQSLSTSAMYRGRPGRGTPGPQARSTSPPRTRHRGRITAGRRRTAPRNCRRALRACLARLRLGSHSSHLSDQPPRRWPSCESNASVPSTRASPCIRAHGKLGVGKAVTPLDDTGPAE